jgi:hypothetical protein
MTMGFMDQFFKTRAGPESPPAALGEFGLPPEAASVILGTPLRTAVLSTIRDRLTDLAPEEKRELVDRVIARFALTVVHLPASADYHHAGSWGLLDHSLEVSLRSLAAAAEMRFTQKEASDPGREYELLPRWRYAAFLFGLLHDVGKIAQIRVETGAGEAWNPFVETLAEFLIRRTLWPPEDRHAAVTWAPKRGLEIHERHNSFFIGRILTPAAAAYLGPVLALALEQREGAGRTLTAVISSGDQESVKAERRARLVGADDQSDGSRPAFVRSDSSVADYFPLALQMALEKGRLTVNTLEGDAFVGDRYVALVYPGAVLKIMEYVRSRWGEEDARAKRLAIDQDGVKRFVKELSLRQMVFRDRADGLWKLKATVTLDGAEAKTFLLLVKKEVLETGAMRPFGGRISCYSTIEHSPVAVDDFGVADAPSSGARTAATKVSNSPAGADAEREAIPVPEFIDPDDLAQKIRDLVVAKKIPTNVPQGVVFVTPEVTYLVWPRAFAIIREAMGLSLNPFEDKKPWYVVLSSMPFVLKDEKGGVISSIKFRPDAPNVCRVVKIDTEGLFPDKQTLGSIGFYRDANQIAAAPTDERVQRRSSPQ